MVPLTRETLARRIRDALAERGVSQASLAAAISMEPSAMSRALAAKRNLGSLEVALIAEELGVPTDVLLAEDDRVPRVTAVAARVNARTDSAVGIAISHVTELLELDHLLGEVGYAGSDPLALPLPEVATPFEQGERLAVALRRQVGAPTEMLPPDPDGLAGWVEQNVRLDVCIMPLPAGLDGLAVTEGRLHLVLVSSGISATRQRFTLMHEVGHLVADDTQQLTVDEDVFSRQGFEEKRANTFAAAFLMPRGALTRAVAGRTLDEGVVGDLLGRFRVSLDALAFRLQSTGLVSPAERDRIRRMSSARIANRPGRADDLKARNERRVPGMLLERALRAFSVGDLGIEPLAQLVGVDPDQLLGELTPPRLTDAPSNRDDQVYAL